MRKIVCFLLVLLCCVSMAGCGQISVSADASARVIYDCNGISFTEALTAEEAATVAEILDGKSKVNYWSSTPSCGFDENVAIEIGGTRYALACDKCPTLKICGTLTTYIEISEAERNVLEAIFTARGGKFPCI